MFADESQRLRVFTRVLGVSVLCCLAFSWRLWMARPLYPMVPAGDWVPAFAEPFDRLFLLATASLAALLAVPWRPATVARWLLGAFALLFLQDQSRLWPSFYQFFLLLLILGGSRASSTSGAAERVLNGLRFVVAATYFWSGVQKLNTHFFHEEFPWFVAPLVGPLPALAPLLPMLGAAAAVLETLIGVGLLTRRLRRAALLEAFAMHAVILACIGPLRDNWNNSSWIWSLTAAVQAGVLFWKAPPFSLRSMFGGPARANVPQAAAFVLAGLMPVLNNFNLWDSALSFNVYTGNVHQAEIRLLPEGAAQLPEELHKFLRPGEGCSILSLNAWTLSEFHANPYPENRVFHAVFRAICSRVPPETAALFVREKSSWLAPRRILRYECAVCRDAPPP